MLANSYGVEKIRACVILFSVGAVPRDCPGQVFQSTGGQAAVGTIPVCRRNPLNVPRAACLPVPAAPKGTHKGRGPQALQALRGHVSFWRVHKDTIRLIFADIGADLVCQTRGR